MSLAQSVFNNFIWKLAERCGSQVIQFVVTLVLARLLMPEDYGTIAIIMVFVQVLEVFVTCGLGSALVQKKDADDTDFSSVFFANLLFCALIYCLLYIGSPLIAHFYNNPQLAPLTRVVGLTLIISGVNNVQQAYVSKNLLFKRFFWATLIGTSCSAIGIWMAYSGFGVWALVTQVVTNNAINTLVLWFTVRWRPKRVFSFPRFHTLFNFGYKLLLSGIISTVYNNIRSLIIGKMYSPSSLAFYDKGNQFPSIFAHNINASIDSVIYPAMTKVQDDRQSLKNMMRRAIKVNTFVMAPIMMGMAFAATPIVRLVLTEKWLMIVPFMQIFCVNYMFYPIHTANLNAIKAIGRSDLFLKLEIIKKIVGLLSIICTMWYGVMAMAWGTMVVSVLSQIINSWPNKKLLNYAYSEQLLDIMPNIVIAVLMGCGIYALSFAGLSDFVLVILQVISGIALYALLALISRNDSLQYIYTLVKGLRNGKQ